LFCKYLNFIEFKENTFMVRISKSLTFLFLFFIGTKLSGTIPTDNENIISHETGQDTIKDRQILYNGRVWTNKHRRIEGDQFLFSEFFLPGSISINGRTFSNLRIKYSILSDELLTPLNGEDILQLNREMVDSFSIRFENKLYRFVKTEEDTLKGFNGYVNILYMGKSALYAKYKKEIFTSITDRSDGKFNQVNRIYYVKDNYVYLINKVNDLYGIMTASKEQIRNFIRENKLKVSKKVPESFIPVIKYSDSLSQ
jgi:hypothetical protein